jgi:hypothetical protein
MTFKGLIRIFDERRQKLESLLGDDSLNLKPSRKNQLKGAIEEIDLFLSTLQQHQDKETRTNATSGSLMGKIGSFLRPLSNQQEDPALGEAQ